MRTIYFVWKVSFRLLINQNWLYSFAVRCLMLFPIPSHTQTGRSRMVRIERYSLSNITKKRCIVFPEGFFLRETLNRLNVWFTSCQWRKWLGFEMKSVMYFSHRGPDALKVQLFSAFMLESKSILLSFILLPDLLFVYAADLTKRGW